MKTQPAANNLLHRRRCTASIAAAVVVPAARYGAACAGKLLLGLCGLWLAVSASQGVQADILDVWTPRTSDTTNALNAVAYGQNKFVVVGNGGTILTSPDGAVWTTRASGTGTNLQAITFAQNQFVVMGAGGTVLLSKNGIDWTTHSSGTNIGPADITYGQGLYVAVAGIVGGSAVLRSADGTNWNSQQLSAPSGGIGLNLTRIAFGNSRFVAVGGYVEFGLYAPIAYTSTDGTNWISRRIGVERAWSVAFGNGRFVANAYSISSQRGQSFESTDGTNWVGRGFFTNSTVRDMVFAQGLFVTVGFPGRIFTSSDALTWSVRNSGTNADLSGIEFGVDSFVVVGANGLILQSDRLPPLRFVMNDGSLGFHTNQFGFNVTGPAGQAMVVEGSSNLLDWLPLRTNTLGSNAWFWSDPDSTNLPRRFYRARSQ